LDYLEDVDADFRVFYRIDGIADGEYGGLSAERFFGLLSRLPAYRGVVRARMEAELAEQQPTGGAPQQIGRGAARQGVDKDQFASKAYGAETVPDAETMRRRLEAMGR
jgi:hypothetical protein